MVTKPSSTSAAGSLTHSPALAHIRDAGLVLAGTLALVLIGQITIPLPFTPVPISMGTFAALGVGAVLGSRRGALSAMLLGALAAVGAPVLAGCPSSWETSLSQWSPPACSPCAAGFADHPDRTGPTLRVPRRAPRSAGHTGLRPASEWSARVRVPV